ncbi:helicase-related protein [Methanothermobacter marburgensis]
MGIAAPGRGPITPQIRLWARVLKTSAENTDDEAIRYYWTVVGYYNSIRELGGAIAFYREDVVERLKEISGDDPRDIGPDPLELSSRIDSTALPLVLDGIERDGEQEGTPEYDAIFTTSMFGTGVDVPHLSLMIVNGQPKTTGSYIQATGRIGRKYGGLVLTFLNAARPRDMNHYEMFMKYHARIHENVEPVSVSPYSEGAMSRALGPAAVAFLRNMPLSAASWTENKEGDIILSEKASEDIQKLIESMVKRAEKIFKDKTESSIIKTSLEECMKRWKAVANESDELHFSEYTQFKRPEHDVVLATPAHEYEKLKTVFRNAPNSLRDIEETTGFRV